MSASSKNQKIVVIGAGPSGLAAASRLFENGFANVTILEAEDRIGGRVYTTKLGDNVVDLGGQWVHGEQGNVVFDLANPHDLLEKSDHAYFSRLVHEFVDSRGNSLTEDVAEKMKHFTSKYLADNSKLAYESVGQYLEKMFDKEFEDIPEVLKEKRKYLDCIELGVEAGCSAESWLTMSTTNLFKECEGDQMINWKKGGYSKILDFLLKRFPDPRKELPILKNTVLSCEVKLIDYSGKATPVKITTTKGRIFEADHVIVTVSLGVLKDKHQTLFKPNLSDEKVSAIRGLGYGNMAKVYLLYEKPFWDIPAGKVMKSVFLWNEDERKSIESDPEKSWLLGLAAAYNVEHRPNILQLWISGKHARAMETQPEDKVLNHCGDTLQRFLGKKYKVTRPIGILRTQWYTNPHFRGTISYRSVETQKNNLRREIVEKPVQNLKILFAGEATSEHRYSTVDGAIASGWKAADRILNHYAEF